MEFSQFLEANRYRSGDSRCRSSVGRQDRKESAFGLFFSLLAFLSTEVAVAQCDTTQLFRETAFYEYGEDTLFGTDIWPFFDFGIYNDSMYVQFEIGQFRYNSERLWLKHWCGDTLLDASASILSNHSKTADILVGTSDSIAYIRRLVWVPLDTALYDDIDYYYSPDTLDYYITMHRASTHELLELVDSIGLLRQVPSGFPQVYGDDPLLKEVVYHIPSTYSGDTVYFRVNVSTEGDGPYNFMRRDRQVAGFAAFLSDSAELYRQDYYTLQLPKRYLRHIRNGGSASTERILVINPNPSHDVVEISSEEIYKIKAGDRIEIVDMEGKVVFSYPLKNNELQKDQFKLQLSTRSHSIVSGKYILALRRSGDVLGSTLLIVK